MEIKNNITTPHDLISIRDVVEWLDGLPIYDVDCERDCEDCFTTREESAWGDWHKKEDVRRLVLKLLPYKDLKFPYSEWDFVVLDQSTPIYGLYRKGSLLLKFNQHLQWLERFDVVNEHTFNKADVPLWVGDMYREWETSHNRKHNS